MGGNTEDRFPSASELRVAYRYQQPRNRTEGSLDIIDRALADAIAPSFAPAGIRLEFNHMTQGTSTSRYSGGAFSDIAEFSENQIAELAVRGGLLNDPSCELVLTIVTNHIANRNMPSGEVPLAGLTLTSPAGRCNKPAIGASFLFADALDAVKQNAGEKVWRDWVSGTAVHELGIQQASLTELDPNNPTTWTHHSDSTCIMLQFAGNAVFEHRQFCSDCRQCLNESLNAH